MWSKDKSMPFVGGFGFEFYVQFNKRKEAAVKAIREYPNLLQGYTVENVSSLLSDFFIDVLEDIGIDALFFPSDRNVSVLDLIAASLIPDLSLKFGQFLRKHIRASIHLMPISGIPCFCENASGELMWVPGNYELSNIIKNAGIDHNSLMNGSFPPLKNWDWKRHTLGAQDSWFIVKASSENKAEALFKRMIGTLSIIIKFPRSRSITGRKMIDGCCEFAHDGTVRINTKRSLVPSVALPLEIESESSEVFWNLLSNENSARIHLALEYLADSWVNTSTVSFINNSIAMDALFGINGKVRKSILDGVEKYAFNIAHSKEKYDLILQIRNGVLHGEYSNLESCPQYVEYYECYQEDPADDQIRILNECMRNLAKE